MYWNESIFRYDYKRLTLESKHSDMIRNVHELHSIFRWVLALALNADKNATKSLKFNPSTILSSLCSKSTVHFLHSEIWYMSCLMFRYDTWDRGFIANSGTDRNSSDEMNPFAFLSSWQNLLYRDTISCCETESTYMMLAEKGPRQIWNTQEQKWPT